MDLWASFEQNIFFIWILFISEKKVKVQADSSSYVYVSWLFIQQLS